MEVSKSDWKLFRERIGDWQEAYMERLVKEYMDLLEGEKNASDKFWKLEERIKKDKKHPGVMLELSKGNMIFDIVALINSGAITTADLEDFSDELKESVNSLLQQVAEGIMYIGIADVNIYEEEQADGRILRSLKFRFPVFFNGKEIYELDWDNETTVETVVLLSKH